jgi:glutaconate CoA-transferase subunit A
MLGNIPDGATIGIGGAGLQRKPMTLVRALAAAGAGDLRIVSYLGSVDVEYLIASGVVSEVHSAGVSLDGFGLAPAFRHARQTGTVRFIEWSEGSLAAALQAAALGLPSMPAVTDPRSDVVQVNPHLTVADDPVAGTAVVYAEAIQLDLALIHLSGLDADGNGYIAGDTAADDLLVRSARRVVATADSTVDSDPPAAAVPRIWIGASAVDDRASWPTGSHPRRLVDVGAYGAWAASKGDDPTLLEPKR